MRVGSDSRSEDRRERVRPLRRLRAPVHGQAKVPALADHQEEGKSSTLMPAAESLLFESDHAAPEILRAPYSPTQRFELDNLAVIDEEIHIGTVMLYVPGKHGRV